MRAICLFLVSTVVFGGFYTDPELLGHWKATPKPHITTLYAFDTDSTAIWTTLQGDTTVVVRARYVVDYTRTPHELDLFDFEVLQQPEGLNLQRVLTDSRLLALIEVIDDSTMHMAAAWREDGEGERPRDFTGEVVEFKRVPEE